MTDKIEYIRWFTSMGWRVHPLHYMSPNGCSCGVDSDHSFGKHSRLSNWKLRATNDFEKARAWWDADENSNVGLATGEASGVWVLDVDLKPGGPQKLRELEAQHGALPETLTVRTGSGGFHYFWAWTRGYKVQCSPIAEGLDVRGNDGNIVLPPSNHYSGGSYTIEVDVPPVEAPEWLLRLASSTPVPAEKRSASSVGVGGRNNHLFQHACRLQAMGLPDHLILEQCAATNRALEQPLDDSEVLQIVQSAGRYPKGAASYPTTDIGNRDRLVALAGGAARHNRELGWLVWDNSRWAQDDKLLTRLYDKLLENIATEYAQCTNQQRQRELWGWFTQSQGFNRVEACRKLAEKDPSIDISSVHLDANPLLLGTASGTLDLSKLTVRPPSPDDFITRITPTPYDPTAACPRWEQFLRDVFQHDQDLIPYLQRAVGYSLSGLNTEHCLFFLWGEGRNGKSVFCNVIRHVFGPELSTEMAPGALEERMGGSAHPTELADLMGRRIAFTNETSEGVRLNEARVKALTGGDGLKARFMHKDFVQVDRVPTIWVRGNHKPPINETGAAIWARIKLIRFKRVFSEAEQEKGLEDRLKAEAPGILAWAVRGFTEWSKVGMAEPVAVKSAVQEYKEDSDLMGQFLEDTVVASPKQTLSKRTLYTAYRAWAEEKGLRLWLSEISFSRKLKDRGFTEGRSQGGRERFWLGIAMSRAEAEAAALVATAFGN